MADRVRALLAAVTATAVASAGCSTTTSGAPHGSPTAPASAPSSAPTASATVPSSTASTPSGTPTGFPSSPSRSAPPTSSTGGPGLLSTSGATAALMTTVETGRGFTRTTIDTRSTSGPCKPAGSPTVEDAVPSTVRVGVGFAAGTKALAGELLTVYPDAGTAQRAYDFGESGLNCTTGTLHGTDGSSTPATIKAAGTSTVYNGLVVDQVSAWTVTTSTVVIGFVLARIRNAVVGVQVGSLKGSNTSRLRNDRLIVTAALRKVKQAA